MGPERAVIVDNRNNRNSVVAGSLFTASEHYSGFWLIQAESLEEAKQLALEGSFACNRKVELRPYIQ